VEFTITGLILILIGISAYIFSPAILGYLSIFFIPFTATAIVNFQSGFWLTPFQLFGILWFINKMQNSFITRKSFFPKQLEISLVLVYTFIVVVFLSAMMPIFINGNLSIESGTLGDFSTSTLALTTRNFTAPFYIFFGGIFSLFVASQNVHHSNLIKSLRVLLLSSLFTSLWGLFQFVSFFTGIKYPWGVFNNTTNESAQHYNQILSDIGGFSSGLIRMSSVAAEPSVLAQFLVVAIPFLLFSLFLNKPFFSKLFDSLILCLNTIVLLLSTSASAYIGAFFITLYMLAALFHLRLIGLKVIFCFVLLICAAIFIYFRFDVISDLINLYLFNKLSTGSGSERLKTIVLAIGYFTKYPILGIGWGSVSSFDMFVFILSNTGILGFISFLSLIFYPIKAGFVSILRFKGFIYADDESSRRISIFISILISFITLLSVQTFAGFWYGYGYFWFLLGLTMTVKPSIVNMKKRFIITFENQQSSKLNNLA
jgi:hypothetical protein